MADSGLFIGWGEVVRGREERALEVFNETIAYYGQLQADGRIESFEPCLLEPHGGDRHKQRQPPLRDEPTRDGARSDQTSDDEEEFDGP